MGGLVPEVDAWAGAALMVTRHRTKDDERQRCERRELCETIQSSGGRDVVFINALSGDYEHIQSQLHGMADDPNMSSRS